MKCVVYLFFSTGDGIFDLFRLWNQELEEQLLLLPRHVAEIVHVDKDDLSWCRQRRRRRRRQRSEGSVGEEDFEEEDRRSVRSQGFH